MAGDSDTGEATIVEENVDSFGRVFGGCWTGDWVPDGVLGGPPNVDMNDRTLSKEC